MSLKTKEEVITRQGSGIIVGRFQVPKLTDGHIQLINSVIERHYTVIIAVGVSNVKTTRNNPLNFEMRRKMILSDDRITKDEHSNIIVIDVNDHKDDKEWSKQLDAKISQNIPMCNTPTVLYGSRDSFINYYSGKYTTKELLQETYTTGSIERMRKAHAIYDSEDFRAGVIWATQNRYPVCFPTVDVAIFNEDYTKILLGRKPYEQQYRFIGGFVELPRETDLMSNVYHYNVCKEVQEEANIEIGDIQYIGNYRINDWRYKSEKDSIVTSFFIAKKTFGREEPGDDIVELKWFDVNDIDTRRSVFEKILVNEHFQLAHHLTNYLIESRN